MRKFIKISAIAAALAAVASCDLNKEPVFTDDMSFAAFDVSAVSVKESGESVSLPVTIASIDPVKVNVTYKVIVDEAYKAEQGTDFVLVDDSGVLAFDGKERTAYIDIKINAREGVFTGDLKFAIELVSAGTLNLGHENTCVVTIQDEDHPLAFILGEYTSNTVSNYWGSSSYQWDITISKDAEDINVVWISNLDPYFAKYGYTAPKYNYFYGNVNDDKTEITLPEEQPIGYESDGAPCVLVGLDADGENSDDVHVTISDDGKTLTVENYWGIYNDGWWNLFKPGAVVFTKK